MIPQVVYELVCIGNKGASERGVALLDCVESRIEAVPSDFTKVVNILEGEGFLRPGAEELVNSYCESVINIIPCVHLYTKLSPSGWIQGYRKQW